MSRGTIIFTATLLLISIITLVSFTLANQTPEDIISPYDRVRENQIQVLSDKVIINIEGASWSRYEDTNSMDPFLDKGANGIELIPKNENDLHVGDIVAYESKYMQGLIVHRIIDIKENEEGKYFILKGDNNKTEDPEKIKFNQIKYVLIGIIY